MVSVIIPCYNVENYVKKSIESVLNQSYENIQVVIVDDGSTDNSSKVIQECIENRSNVTFIQNKNMGVSNARNTGISFSKGEYIMFLDSDDYISKKIIKNMLTLMNKYDSDLVKCNIKKDYVIENRLEKVKPIYSKVRNILEIDFSNIIYKKILSTETMNSVCCSLFKTSIIKENKLNFREDIHNGEDAIFFMNYVSYCKSMVYTPAAYYHYTIRNTGLTGTGLSMNKLWDSKLKFIVELRNKEKNWNLTKYNYVDKKIIYIVMSCIIRLYKKDKNLSDNYKKDFLNKMIQDVNLIIILDLVNYKKLNFTKDRIDILDEIKGNNIEGAINKIKLV
jgi:glycosyltransferase involved in cell wall biosynthesis